MDRELRQEIEELGAAVKAFKETNDEKLEKLAKGETVAELETKLTRIETVIEKSESRVAELEAENKNLNAELGNMNEIIANGGGFSSKEKKLNEEHRDAFYDMIRNGGRSSAVAKCLEVQDKYVAFVKQEKRVDLTAGASGEFLLPEVIRAEVETMEQKMSPVRQLIPVVSITTNDFKQNVDINGTGSGWVGETDTRSVTGTPQLRQRAPTMGELYARPEATQWAALDLSQVDNWLSRSVAEEFTKQEGQAVISGNGTNKPTGFLNTSPVATADDASPLRSAEALQFVAAPSPDDITEHVLSLIYALQSGYRAGAAFALNSNTLSAIRRAKGSDGHYLWQPALTSGEPSTIGGYPFVAWEDMPDQGASPAQFPIAFGNWSRGYLLVQRSEIRVIRDEVTNPGFIRWYFFRREGGIILNNDAIKVAQR